MFDHPTRNGNKFIFRSIKAVFLIFPLLLLVFPFSGYAHTTYAATPDPYTIYLPYLTNNYTSVTGTAEGRILWNSQPMAGVTVKLCVSWSIFGGCTSHAYTGVSGSDGRYSIFGVPVGEYKFVTKLSDQPTETLWLGMRVNIIAGQTVSVRDVNVVKYDLKLTSPMDHATVGATPTLTWETYPSAAYYKVYVSNSDTYETVVNFEKVTTPHYSFSNPLPAAEYYWSIDAYNSAGIQIAESASSYYFVVAP